MRPIVDNVLFAIAYTLLLFGSAPACKPSHIDAIRADLIDCTKGQLAQISELTDILAPALDGGEIEWRSVEDAAIRAGIEVGGCAIAHLASKLQQIRGFAGPNRAEVALARLRTSLGQHPTFVTAEGKL